ncbi:MAG TPA: site-2 protease family protein [Atribacteraceae bacterium]|nr:site-2 protease family protein [Atribacteraceae bacterium]
MNGNRLTLFSLFGFAIRIDLSWIIILFLVIWSLGMGVFPNYFEGLPTAVYWWMGVIGALGLFFSIISHELSHSLVARKFGLVIKGITLFIFGGVAEMEEEPPSARAEFYMALAGPVSSLILGMFFYGLFLIGGRIEWPRPVLGILWYLGTINFVLAGFNLIPAFPLDGGRILRSALWSWKGSLTWATRVSSRTGTYFGIFLIALGILNFLRGALISGIWLFLIGMFIQNASQSSLQRTLMTKALEGEKVRRFMKPDPMTVPSNLTIAEFVEDYVYRYHYKMFPVVDQDKLIGCANTRDIKELPREKWSEHELKDLIKNCSLDNTISPEADATQALSRISKSGNSRLLVVEDGKLVGVITLKDLLNFFSLKMELEGEDRRR